MYSGHRDQHFGCSTYSQHGEDLQLLNIFSLLGIEKPSYIDLGSHDPEIISNTKLLYDRGSRGINVEANPNLIDAFKLMRPKDVNVNVGVGLVEGDADFLMYDKRSGRNTFSLREAESISQLMKVREVIKLPVKTLNQIIDEYSGGKFPAILSCDIEGLDYDVLDTADMEKSKPIVIIVETRRSDTRKMKEMMWKKDFRLLVRMGENLIFIHRDYWEKVF